MRRPDSAIVLVIVMLSSLLSTPVSAAASLSVMSDSIAETATTDNPAEYTITVVNDGDEDLTVTLSSSQQDGANCNGFSSTIETTPFSLGEGESEQKTLTVTVNDQASGECITTVTANGVPSALGASVQDDIEVTTSAEGGGQYSVLLEHKNPSNGVITYDGDDDEVVWTVDVKNTGENDATVQLSMASSSSCDSDGLEATVNPQQMQLSSEESEEAEVTVTLEEGSSTESGNHCFILEATVSNDPNSLDQANDSLEVNLKIPEVKTCDSDLQFTSHNLDPGQTASNSISISNTGNTAWTVTAFAMSEGVDVSEWVDFETPTSRLLSEPGGSQDSTQFDFDITPDDSVEPGTLDVYIQGRAGSSIGCESLLRVNLGQVHDATLSLSDSTVSNVDPGSTASISMQVTNTGNGQDNFAIGVKDLQPGWQVEISETYITLDGRHCSSPTSCDRRSVQVQISVPSDGKAGIEYPVTMYVNSQGVTLDEVSASVTIAAVHEGSIEVRSDSQTGRFGDWVSFPIDITNTGNTQDTFFLDSCDPNVSPSCEGTKWETKFKDIQGNSISQISLESDETSLVYLDVLVSDNINNNSETFEARIGIFGTDIMMKELLTVTVSNFNYSMSVAFESPGEDPSMMELALPPGGRTSTSLVVTNTGDGGADDVVISISGMDSSVLKTISVDGVILEGDEVKVPANGQITLDIEFQVMEVDSGTSGVIRISSTSKKNTGQTPSFIELVVDVRAIHDLEIELEGATKLTSSYPENTEFTIFVTNHGNVEEDVEVLTSDSLRGWTVDVIGDEFKLKPGKTREVPIRVTPPSDMIADDEYMFTVIVQPKGLPVAGEPIDLSVESKLGPGSISAETQTFIAIGVIVIGSLSVTYLFASARAENRVISDTVRIESDDSS